MPATGCPVGQWRWCQPIAATRRAAVAGAAGQPARNASTVPTAAGSAGAPVAAHQSVNSAQSVRYPAGTRVPVEAAVLTARAG